MSKQAVSTNEAPKPIPGVYNQAIVANGFVYCSGQVGDWSRKFVLRAHSTQGPHGPCNKQTS